MHKITNKKRFDGQINVGHVLVMCGAFFTFIGIVVGAAVGFWLKTERFEAAQIEINKHTEKSIIEVKRGQQAIYELAISGKFNSRSKKDRISPLDTLNLTGMLKYDLKELKKVTLPNINNI